MYDSRHYPALTYQHVVDLTDLFGGLPAVPQMVLRGVDEMEALIEALIEVRDLAREQEELAAELGFPVNAGDEYVGTGTVLVVEGPGDAQLLVVGSRRMRASDVPNIADLYERHAGRRLVELDELGELGEADDWS